MKVSKRSWHYRLNNWFSGGGYQPRDLCSYFWRTVGVAIFPLLVIAAIGVLITAVVLVIMAFIDDWLQTLITLGAMVGVVIAYVLLVLGIGRGVKKVGLKRPRFKDSLIGQYTSAKKRRICPLIELEEGEIN